MVKFLFASNNIVHFPTAVASSVVGTFEPTRVPYSLGLKNAQIIPGPTFLTSDTDETWFHYLYYPGTTNFSESDLWFSAYDASNRLLFDLYKLDNSLSLLPTMRVYNGTTTLTTNATLPMTAGIMNAIDIRCAVTLVTIQVDFYVNGGLSATLSFGTNPNNYTKPNKFRISTGFTNGSTQLCHFSEIFVTNEDSRNGKLHLLRPSGAGALNDWTGSLTTLVDEDPASGMTTIEPAAAQTALLTPYSGPSNISNVAIVTSTSRGINSPTKLKHILRASGVTHESAEVVIGNPYQYNISDFDLNPATSLPWVSSDLSAIEAGFLSVA